MNSYTYGQHICEFLNIWTTNLMISYTYGQQIRRNSYTYGQHICMNSYTYGQQICMKSYTSGQQICMNSYTYGQHICEFLNIWTANLQESYTYGQHNCMNSYTYRQHICIHSYTYGQQIYRNSCKILRILMPDICNHNFHKLIHLSKKWFTTPKKAIFSGRHLFHPHPH